MTRFWLAFALFCPASSSWADASGASFLLLDMDAAGAAQGAAVTAHGASLGGMRSNPAALGGLKNASLAVTHLAASGDWDHDWLAFSFPLGSLVAGAELLSSRMRPFPYYGEDGEEAGMLEAGSFQAALALARPFRRGSLGACGRLFRGQLDQYSNWGYAGDFGVQWWPLESVTLGAALQHWGEQTAYYALRDPLPSLWRLGVEFHDQSLDGHLGFAVDVDYVRNMDPGRASELHLGGELELLRRLALRCGMRQQGQLWAPSLGLGFRLGILDLAYAYRPVQDLGADHMISLSLKSE